MGAGGASPNVRGTAAPPISSSAHGRRGQRTDRVREKIVKMRKSGQNATRKSVRRVSIKLTQTKISSKPKGPGEEGAAGYRPKILLPKKAKMVLCSFHRVIGKSALEIGHFLRRNFWGPFLSRPFCFTADQKQGRQAVNETSKTFVIFWPLLGRSDSVCISLLLHNPWSHKPSLLNGRLENCKIGGCKEQPCANPLPTFANPVPTLCQPFANLSPTLCQPFLPTPLQPPISVDPRHPFRDTS